MAHDPVVFISSTSVDLKEHRKQAAEAALASGFAPRMMEYFAASGHAPSLQACLEKVGEAEVVVVLVAHRYGWVPEDPGNPTAKSITWLECDHARKVCKKDVLAFLVDPNYHWPAELREDYRLIEAKNQPVRKQNQIRKEVKRNERKLEQFKRELSSYFQSPFTDAAGLRPLISEALAEWHKRHPTGTPPPGDPEPYLKTLEEGNRQIRIRHLKTRRAEPYFFGIDQIYIPLTMTASYEPPREGAMDEMQRERPISLEKELSNPKVVIVGHAGSGKSTFLSRMAFELCRNLRGACPSGAVPFLNPEDKRFPILVRIADFAMMLEAEAKSNGLSLNSEQWIPRYLGRRTTIEETFFRKKLEQGGCLVMLDGLDEAPNSQMRERIARLFENTTKRYPKCDYLVSTRPQSYEGDTVLEGFQQVRIGDLERPEIHVFLNHFSQALELNEREAKAFRDGLEKALDDRIEIREMGRNPLMLTALAVLQHGGAKLPEYRYELYESILGWLVKAREDKEGRLPDKQCLQYLRRLALAMQDFKEGRLRQINRREAAELLAHEFGGTVGNNEDLLERETHDSGIISSVGKDLQFWHLSLQEYLAAKEISGLTDANQIARVVKSGKLYRAEWREMMRLLGGVLCGEQGAPKIEGLFRAILKQLGREPALVEQARCAALLGAMMRDLSRMGYEPKTPDYERTVKAVMRIFDAATDRIDIRIRIEAADVLGQVGDPRLEDDNWVTIPTGTFYMGAQTHDKESRNYDPEAHDNESPVHEMELKGFRIRRFPVTVQEFGAFIKDKGYEARKYWGDGYGLFDTPADWERQIDHLNRPVVGVSWFEAAAYSAWAGGRLPTEAEWERVARGPQGGRYPWCDEAPLDPSRANYARQVGHPTPVGLYPQGNTAEGLCDMLGNVWEWCDDWFIPYHESPTGPKAKDARVWRGGSWSSRPLFVRVSNRYGLDPTNRHNNTGFRCAQTE